MHKAPAFQFYPQDFLADLNVKLMTTEAVGAYLLLLCHDWIEDGLPGDDEALAVLSGMRERWPEVREQVLKCFTKRRGKIFNPRLEAERKKQKEFRKKKSKAGKASAKSRARNALDENPEVNTCSTDVPTGVEEVLQQNSTLQSSSSSSSSDKETISKEIVKKNPAGQPPEAYADRMAEEFTEPFQELAQFWKRSLRQVLDRKSREGILALLSLGRPLAEVKATMSAFVDAKKKAPPNDWLSTCTLKGMAEGHYSEFVKAPKQSAPKTEIREARCPDCNTQLTTIVAVGEGKVEFTCANRACGKSFKA